MKTAEDWLDDAVEYLAKYTSLTSGEKHDAYDELYRLFNEAHVRWYEG